jgi:hypothetical protein
LISFRGGEIGVRVGDIIGMVALGIIIVAGVLIIANFHQSIGRLGLTGTANTTATTAINNVYTGLQLGAIGIIILAAVGLIALVLGAFGAAPRR